MMELLKSLIPIIIFCLGILTAPVIELRKEKTKAKKRYNNLVIEIKDELKELSSVLIRMADVYLTLVRLKSGEYPENSVIKFIPKNTSIYFLKPVIDTSFEILDEKQRYAIKSLFVQIGAIDEYLKEIKGKNIKTIIGDKNKNEELEEAINDYKRYLFTGSCMLNTMRIIVKDSNASFDKDDKNVIDGVFNELRIDIPANELIIKSKKYLEN